MIPGIVASQITTVPIWATTSSTSYTITLSVSSASGNTIAVTAAVNAQYPAVNYTQGTVARLRVYDLNMNLLTTTYRIVSTA